MNYFNEKNEAKTYKSNRKGFIKNGGFMEEKNQYEEILLFSSVNDYQINEISAMLTENEIPFIRKDYGVGAYMNLYMGHSYEQKSIFVSKEDYNKALELISIFTTNDIDEENEILEEEKQSENNRTSYTLTLISKIAIWTVLILPILILLLMLVLLMFQ